MQYIHSAEADANTPYDKFEHQISQVVDKHAPIKQAYQRRMKLPCMNGHLKKAIFFKKKVFNEYKKIAIVKLGKNTGLREI